MNVVKAIALLFCAIIIGCGEAKNTEQDAKKASVPEAMVNRVSAPIERAKVTRDSTGKQQSRIQERYKSEVSIQ
jgi:hypothetical protein